MRADGRARIRPGGASARMRAAASAAKPGTAKLGAATPGTGEAGRPASEGHEGFALMRRR